MSIRNVKTQVSDYVKQCMNRCWH